MRKEGPHHQFHAQHAAYLCESRRSVEVHRRRCPHRSSLGQCDFACGSHAKRPVGRTWASLRRPSVPVCSTTENRGCGKGHLHQQSTQRHLRTGPWTGEITRPISADPRYTREHAPTVSRQRHAYHAYTLKMHTCSDSRTPSSLPFPVTFLLPAVWSAPCRHHMNSGARTPQTMRVSYIHPQAQSSNARKGHDI